MSGLLVEWIASNTPAGGLDQLVLLHLARELHAPDATKDDLPTGNRLGPGDQHQNTHRNGGGYLSMENLGRRVWPEQEPAAAATTASNRVRRLRGEPNATGKAWFPALVWETSGGSWKDTFDGAIRNRRSVWRLPLINRAALVDVPKSASKAAAQGWSVDDAWKAAIEQLANVAVNDALSACSDDLERHKLDVDLIAGTVRAEIATARRAQEAAVAGDVAHTGPHHHKRRAAS